MKRQIWKIRGTSLDSDLTKQRTSILRKFISDSPMSKQTHIALFLIISI